MVTMLSRSRSGRLHWIRATLWGWVLGLAVTVVLALAGEAAGVGGAQAIVGLGMGAGVGLMQGRALFANRWWRWAVVSAIGLAAPFVLVDALGAAGVTAVAYSLIGCVALGGIAAGAGQVLLFRPAGGGWRWVLASGAGWLSAGVAASAAQQLPRALGIRGAAGAALYLGVALSGALALGVVTGIAVSIYSSFSDAQQQRQ